MRAKIKRAINEFQNHKRQLRLKLKILLNSRKIRRYRESHKESLIYADMILSAGAACKVAHHMAQAGLRQFSSPLDWMMNYSLNDIAQIFHDDFKNFFANIKEDSAKTQELRHNGRWIIDAHNGMVDIHSFRKDEAIAKRYPEFIKMINRRFARIKSRLKSAKSVLFICNRDESVESMSEFLLKMQSYHNTHYTLLNIRHDSTFSPTDEPQRECIDVSDSLKIIQYAINDTYIGGGVRTIPSKARIRKVRNG